MPRGKTGWRWDAVGLFLAAAWAMAGLLLPGAWFRPAAVNEELTAPLFDGMILLRVCFVLEAVVAVASVLVIRRWAARRSSLPFAPEGGGDAGADPDPDVSSRFSGIAIAFLTLAAAALRFYKLDSPLWLDEISPIVDYGHLSPVQVFSTYLGSNNHVLNTLLVNGMVSVFGAHEWAVRLPAALFGIASIPAIYLLARTALSSRASLCATALLAFSYHHVFFSQNARGYSAYLFFAVMASWLFVRALRTSRTRDWCLYAAAAVLEVFSLLNGVFLVAAHAIVAVLIALRSWRRDGVRYDLGRTTMVYGTIGLILVHLYSLVIPQAYSVMNTTYRMNSAGFSSPVSPEFLRDLLSGMPPFVIAGALFGGPILAAVAALGLWRLFRASPLLTAILVLPNALLTAFVIVERLAVTPRLFFFALVPCVIVLASGTEVVASCLSRRLRKSWAPGLLALATGFLAIGLGAGLVRYYSIPKQNYPGAVKFIAENHRPGDAVIVLYLAKYGYGFYASRLGMPLDEDTYFVRDPAAFQLVLLRHPGARVWIVSTFERALGIDLPDIHEALESEWDLAARFPGTIGDGNVLVYRSKPRATEPGTS